MVCLWCESICEQSDSTQAFHIQKDKKSIKTKQFTLQNMLIHKLITVLHTFLGSANKGRSLVF